MKGKSRLMAMAAVMGLGLMMLAAGGKVKVSDTLIAHEVINAAPEEVIAWLGTDGEGFSINKDTEVITDPWWPGAEFKTLDGLTAGQSLTYTLSYAGIKFSGEAVRITPPLTRPSVPSTTKYIGDHDATLTILVVPVKEGSKLILVADYEIEVAAAKAQAVKHDIEQHMQNAVKIIKQGVEKKKAAQNMK